MGALVSLLTGNHQATNRDYTARATAEKYRHAEIAKKFDYDYWDGDRRTGYGGYRDDGRWQNIAKSFLQYYDLPQQGSLLDIGCGKGFFLKEVSKLRPDLKVAGLDISNYALRNSSKEIRDFLTEGSAAQLNYDDRSFDLVVSMNTLHNLSLPDLFSSLQSIERKKKLNAYICVESYRNEKEKWNLMQWQLTCECFFSPQEWIWIFNQAGYTGDYEFIYFE